MRLAGELIHIDIKTHSKFNQIGHRITKDRTRQSGKFAFVINRPAIEP